MTDEKTMTTGEGFAALRRDLIEGGFDQKEAFAIVMEYARSDANLSMGFIVLEDDAAVRV